MAASKNKGFCMFFDWVEALDHLEDSSGAWKIVKALSEYFKNGKNPVENLSGNLRVVAELMYHQILRLEARAAAKRKAAEASHTQRQINNSANAVQLQNVAVQMQCNDTITKTKTITNTKTNITTTTTTDNVRAYAREENSEKEELNQPCLLEVKKYFEESDPRFTPPKNTYDATKEAEIFCAWNNLRGWRCLPEWKTAADLWMARLGERRTN